MTAKVIQALSTQKGSLSSIRDSGLVQVLAGSLNKYGNELCTAKEDILNLLEVIAVLGEEEIKAHLRIEICPHLQVFVERNECYAYASPSRELKPLVDTIVRSLPCK